MVSERRVCGLLSLAVSSYRYQVSGGDEGLRRQVVQLAREKPRFIEVAIVIEPFAPD